MSTATTIPARREALEEEPSRGVASLARKWFATLWRFLLGQGLTQFLALGTGLLLVWFLPKEQYAQYSVAFAFQATMSALVDLGMVSSIVALVGDRGHKPEVIGRYLASGQRLRGFLFLIVAVGVVVLFPLLTMKHGWATLTLAGLMLGVIAFVYCQRLMMYAAPLLIHNRLQPYYRAQLLGAGIKLSGVVLLWAVGLLDAITAVWVSVLAIVLHGMVFRHAAGPLVDQPPRSEPQTDREVRKVIGPLMPTVVFTAFQAHIAVFLITVFGNADAIADIGALGKLWQLFVLLNAFSLVVVQPRLARLKPGEVPVRYAQLVALLAVLVTGITLAAYAFPQPVLAADGAQVSPPRLRRRADDPGDEPELPSRWRSSR